MYLAQQLNMIAFRFALATRVEIRGGLCEISNLTRATKLRPQYVSDLCRGIKQPTGKDIEKICLFYKMKTTEFYNDGLDRAKLFYMCKFLCSDENCKLDGVALIKRAVEISDKSSLFYEILMAKRELENDAYD